MIDSTGWRFLRADGTVFDLLPVGKALGWSGTLLVILFVLVKPEASAGLGTPARIAFWATHVGVGLGALLVASRWLASGRRLPGGTLAAVLASGLAGLVIAAPGYLALDALFGPHLLDRDPSPEPAAFPLAALFAETTELAPWFMTAWLLINLPVLMPRAERSVRIDDGVAPRASPHPKDASPAVTAGFSSPVRLVGGKATEPATSVTPLGEEPGRFLSTLPGVVGTDIVAVSSDLHYLNVWTASGRTTVLGNLREVVEELGERGLQVHRSHWVAHAHVRRIVGTAGDAACILSNELRVPISRRRWKSVREQFGRGVVHAGSSVSEETRVEGRP